MHDQTSTPARPVLGADAMDSFRAGYLILVKDFLESQGWTMHGGMRAGHWEHPEHGTLDEESAVIRAIVYAQQAERAKTPEQRAQEVLDGLREDDVRMMREEIANEHRDIQSLAQKRQEINTDIDLCCKRILDLEEKIAASKRGRS